MRYYIVNNIGDVLADVSTPEMAEAILREYPEEQIKSEELEIIEGQ